ncbi:MAG: hypothetical protein IKC77_09990, partial [Lentisphaeria bacterium]|nr:hypothetical protein [Lentisphaeria bacterium]
EKKPNVGFVILFPLSRHSLGDGGSLPFKKSGETFLFTFTYPCREQSLQIKKTPAQCSERDCTGIFYNFKAELKSVD